MTIVNPLTSANLVVQTTLNTGRPEERQNDLRIEQIVRATVVEGGLDRATLEMNQQRFRITTEQELQTGQQLELKVLTTHPQLTFKVLSVPLETRFATLLPLLASPFDWDALLQQLQTFPAARESGIRQTLELLEVILKPPAAISTNDLTDLVVSLTQLRRCEPLFATPSRQIPVGAPPAGATPAGPTTTGAALAAAFDRVLGDLGRQVEELELPQQLRLMAAQIRSEPLVLKQFAAVGKERISALLKSIEQPFRPLTAPQAWELAVELKNLLQEKPLPLPQQLAQSTRELGVLLKQEMPRPLEVGPRLLVSLQKLTLHLQRARREATAWPLELRQVVDSVLQQLQPLVAEPEILVQGEKLGLLSQLFGLNLEVELLRGKTREALRGLKLVLLGAREQLGSKGEEALHRLELFQVCRARMAEQNQLFIPLPFPFLEEGFLLIEGEDSARQEAEREREEVRMSLHLRLSALGNLRIDLLAEQGGVHLRVACEDQDRIDFLRTQADLLRGRMTTLALRGLTFTLGAQAPNRELLQRLLPQARGMLDARI